VIAALAVVAAVACVCGAALKGLQMWLAHQRHKVEHAPVAELQRKLDELEGRLLQLQMARR
jgi:hypothetical protein